MAYPVDRIIPVNIILAQAGLQYANFVTLRAIGTVDMLADGVTFDVDTYRTYDRLTDVAVDFNVDSEVYLMASNWFSQTPKPSAESFQVWMWDQATPDTLIETLNKSENAAKWMYFIGIPTSAYQSSEETCLELASWADANEHMIALTFTDDTITDENVTTDIPSLLYQNGSRRITQKYRQLKTVNLSELQEYAAFAELACFQRFNFDGVSTSVDPEFKALSNVIGADMAASQYTALESKRVGFYTPIELKGSTVTSRVKNSWTTSSYNETVDDVFSLDVLKNRIQVDAFNYLSRRKRGLRRPADYAGMIATVEAVCRQAFINGTLAGDVNYVNPETGEDVVLKNGFFMVSKPDDVRDLTEAQIAARAYPPIQVVVVLARSARVCEINVYVE